MSLSKRQQTESRFTTALLIGIVGMVLLAGCSTTTEKPKAENGGTYYEGPLQKQKQKAQ